MVNPRLVLSRNNSPRHPCSANLLLVLNSSSPPPHSLVNPLRATPNKRRGRPCLDNPRVPISSSKSLLPLCSASPRLGLSRRRRLYSANPQLERNSNSPPLRCLVNLQGGLNSNHKTRLCLAVRHSHNRRPCLDSPPLGHNNSNLPLLCLVNPQGRRNNPQTRSERLCLVARPSQMLLRHKRQVFSAPPLRPNLQQVLVCLGAPSQPRLPRVSALV